MIYFDLLSQSALLIYAVIIFVILAAIACLILYRYIKESTTFIIKPKDRRSKDILDLSEAIGNEANKNEGEERFSKLLIEDHKKREEIVFDEVNSLKAFADDFRNYSAHALNLFYTEKDIRAFIANLATSKIMILQGMSGTGKTSIALAFQKYVGNILDPIAIQPMWKERSDLIGYYNEFTKKFNETRLLEELYESNFDDKMYIIVLDEVNIARVEYYFAEFLSLLEYPNSEQRTLEITNDVWDRDPKKLNKGRLPIRDNVYFLGTANNDESTFAISDKVYDRAMVINLEKKAEKFSTTEAVSHKISNTNFLELANKAEEDFKNNLKEYNEVKTWVENINLLLNEYFGVNFGNRMVNQINRFIPVYVACGGTKEEAFDDFVSKKILRKLESKDVLKISSKVKPFCNKLDLTFGQDNMKLSKEYVYKFNIVS